MGTGRGWERSTSLPRGRRCTWITPTSCRGRRSIMRSETHGGGGRRFYLDGLDRFNLGVDFGDEGFKGRVEAVAFGEGEFVEEIGIGGDLDSLECGKADCVGNSATDVHQGSHVPGIVLD